MVKKLSSLTLGLALAGLLSAGAATAQTPQNNTAEVENPHSPDNAKRPDNNVPRAETNAMARPAEDANVDSTDNKNRVAPEGAGPSATGNAEAGNPHSVVNHKGHHKVAHRKATDPKPMATPAAPADNK